LIRRICVFCGSSMGFSPRYAETAAALGKLLAGRGIGLVYGGASVGTMGVVADAALAEGGEVIGVIPESMSTVEIAHAGLSELHVVADMHERKAKMAALSDGFLALPGGAGTLEELFEVWTWARPARQADRPRRRRRLLRDADDLRRPYGQRRLPHACVPRSAAGQRRRGGAVGRLRDVHASSASELGA